MPAFSRLIRFLAKDGATYYGDALVPRGLTDLSQVQRARVITGDIFGAHVVTDQIADVARLLCPLAARDVSTVRCLGLNYRKHAKETNLPEPVDPVLFFKPVTALSGPSDPIPIPPMATEYPGLDYECELVVVIGRQARDVSEKDALDCVLGYCVGNDVSQREWQLKRGGGQWNLGKMFDRWAPMGPAIVGPELLPEGAKGLRISTKVNGETRQDESTSDLIFGVAKTVSFLSRGTTLMPGDVIFTGTPAGVALGMKEPRWLKDGDVVEIALEGVGSIRNTLRLETDKAKL